ncbi:hypothetical protein GK047_00115 [Paenibacillus sp. SYP-B3998]|uniref:Peptidase n=1 Tax=Paenibacillus sp. SYP-B3998 TaxID=2678564 RepID=A0A6G3ZS63_9BACL|nr:DUF1796 family putative cysteine peptidase [Paenibacillus sp. SYP-B3998]NEW04429.1 hypothetical protein [Paenibacillus sp. SYP-B3998]
MQLIDLSARYDMVISLGGNCQTAYQLDKNKLRTFSGPLDWVTSYSVPGIIKMLETRFEGYMDLSHMKVIGANPYHYTVEDHFSGCVSYHDFPINNEADPFITYSEFKIKLNHRIDTFYDRLANTNSVLFIRLSANMHEAINIRKALKTIVFVPFHLLIVNYTNLPYVLDKDWGLTGISNVEITEDIGRWQGHDNSWEYLLKSIALK